MGYHHIEWTPRRIIELTLLWDEGWSLNKLAAHLGTTRGSISGKSWRLKLRPRQEPECLARALGHVPKVYPVPDPAPGTCHWPVGVPVHHEFPWCGKKQMMGRRFCQEHEVKYYLAMRFGESVPIYSPPPFVSRPPSEDQSEPKEKRTVRHVKRPSVVMD
jgi:GcrA cell cycle regulator